VGTFDYWDSLLADDDPDPMEIIRAAGMYTRYLDAVVIRAAKEATQRGVTAQELSTAFGQSQTRAPWRPGPASS
jgi:hypothetical protein